MNEKEILNDNTMSVCEHCYRHTPAVRFKRNGQIWLGKTCKVHGYSEHLVEPDADFYLGYQPPVRKIQDYLQAYCLDITNRCNLTCPHCYQLPDNLSKDPPIDLILETIKSWEDDGRLISLMGAEPTVRKDLPELIEAIQKLPGKPRKLIVLTNGVKLSDLDYAKQFSKFDNLLWTFGLNHPDYQGAKVRQKQEQGINNCIEAGLTIKNISYTLEGFHQLEYCLDEIQRFGTRYAPMYRIRVGAEIGRSPDADKMYMSELIKHTKEICLKRNWEFKPFPEMGIRAHYPAYINGILVKLIQWPDVRTLDLEELQTEAWADMLPGKPISPLVHQVILRDGAINKGLPLLDTVPEKYRL